MSDINISIRIPEESWAQIVEHASRHDANPDDVVHSAIQEYFDMDEETRLAVEEGIRQADAGEVVDHDIVVDQFEARKLRATRAA